MHAPLPGPMNFEVTVPETDKDRKYTVFIVDDSLDDRTYAMKLLATSPYIYNVHAFEDGDKLMAHLKAHDFYDTPVMRNMPLLILLDLYMPGTNGIGILSTLREHPLTKYIPIIILTNDAGSQTVADAYARHVNAFLHKPLHLDAVHDVILKGHSWPLRGDAGKET